ncbi:hypothetical protein ACRN9F_14125 [Shewanella oncorhynchi]|uniref:hypothetical protein n=1 Tax=Shewanella oncorhynchi TaxID=2726434 RepID=UPI003D7B6D53
MQFLLGLVWLSFFLFSLWLTAKCFVVTIGTENNGLFDKSLKYKFLGVSYWLIVSFVWDFCFSFITIKFG